MESLNFESLISKAVETGNLEMVDKIMVMRDCQTAKNREIEFRKAMSSFQAECPIIEKDKSVPDKSGKERYRYAPLGSIYKQVRESIGKYGFSYSVHVEDKEGSMKVVVGVHHVSGHSESSSFTAPIDLSSYMSQPQKYASAQTFIKRYAFCNAFGILTGDEDTDADDLDKTTDKPKAVESKKAEPAKPAEETKKPEPPKEIDPKLEQIKKLPESIRGKFKNDLKYGVEAAWVFCESLNWNPDAIEKEIDSLLSMAEPF